MINSLTLEQDKLIASFDKEKLAKEIIAMLPNYEVMFIYFGGSVAYKTFIPGKSDLDVICFCENLERSLHVNIGNADVFIYAKEHLKTRFEITKDLDDYNLAFSDDYLALPKTLIYLNPKFEKEYQELINLDFSKVLHSYLTNFYDYFMFMRNGFDTLSKRFYHVIRVRGQLVNYLETKRYSLDLPIDYFNEAIDLKLNADKKETRMRYERKIDKYLEEINEIKEGLKDG